MSLCRLGSSGCMDAGLFSFPVGPVRPRRGRAPRPAQGFRLVLLVLIWLGALVPAAMGVEPAPVGPAELQHLEGPWSPEKLALVQSGLASQDKKSREEALHTIRRLPVPPGLMTPALYEAIIDCLPYPDDSVKIQALLVLTEQFPEHERVREVLQGLPGTLFPAYLHPWVQIVMKTETDLLRGETRLRQLHLGAEQHLLQLAATMPKAEAASLTAQWLREQPGVRFVENAGEVLWFATEDNLESGIMLAGVKEPASATIAMPRATGVASPSAGNR